MTLEELAAQLVAVRDEASAAAAQAQTLEALEALRVKYLGRKSTAAEALGQIGHWPAEQRGAVGKSANEAKRALEQALAERRNVLAAAPQGPSVDVTLPGIVQPLGRLHPITQTLHAIVEAFLPLGFEIVEGPEVEYERHNFDDLNIPSDHP